MPGADYAVVQAGFVKQRSYNGNHRTSRLAVGVQPGSDREQEPVG